MARPTYIDIPDTDVDLDSPAKTDLFFKRVRDNINALRIQLIPINILEKSTNLGAYDTLTSISLFLPNVADYAGIARRIVAVWDGKVSGGGNASYRLRDSASGDTSNVLSTTSATYVPLGPFDLTVDPAWLSGDGVIRTFQIQAQTTAGTAFMEAPSRMSWYQEY